MSYKSELCLIIKCHDCIKDSINNYNFNLKPKEIFLNVMEMFYRIINIHL